jgi:hypothetical protein
VETQPVRDGAEESTNSTADLPDPFVDDPELRFLVKMENGHWLWTGERDLDGYGLVFREGYNWRAHRWVWSLVNGLTDLPLDHLCRVRRCVNPDHLEAVTTAVNNERIPTWGGNAQRCSKGHEFTPENTISRADGKRRCRTCHRDQERERRARRAAG